MPVQSVSEFLSVLEESQLLHPRVLRKIGDEVARASASLSVERLATCLVRSHVLTRYQALRLLAGHRDGFYVGKYKLFEVLGRGGMGTVYLAEQTTMRRLVALKVITNFADCPPETLIRFRREARAAALLSHPNIVQAYDFDEADGMPFIAMEYVEGMDAADLIECLGRLPWPQAAEYIRQAALGLEHARLQGLVHRDIKPGNLLIATDGTLKLTDLGLCMLTNDVHDVLKHRDLQVGTVDYMAPEQALDCHAVDTRADIYSLGCVFYALLAGRLPFVARNTAQKLLMHQTARPRPIHQHRHDLPTPISDIVHTMMEKRPEDRFQTPGVVAAALERWAEPRMPPYPLTAVKHRRDTLMPVLGRGPEPSVIDVRSQLRGLSAATLSNAKRRSRSTIRTLAADCTPRR